MGGAWHSLASALSCPWLWTSVSPNACGLGGSADPSLSLRVLCCSRDSWSRGAWRLLLLSPSKKPSPRGPREVYRAVVRGRAQLGKGLEGQGGKELGNF